MVSVGKGAARRIPLLQMAELYREPARLNRIQPSIVAFNVVVILLGLTVVANHFHLLGEDRIVCCDRAALATRAEVLAGIEAESGCDAHRASALPGFIFLRIVFRAVSLASVLHHDQIE